MRDSPSALQYGPLDCMRAALQLDSDSRFGLFRRYRRRSCIIWLQGDKVIVEPDPCGEWVGPCLGKAVQSQGVLD